MSLKVTWTTYAKISYYQEIDFIDKMWTIKEVHDFIFLIEDFIALFHLKGNLLLSKALPYKDTPLVR